MRFCLRGTAVLAVMLSACGGTESSSLSTRPRSTEVTGDSGALVKLEMNSTVGVLLDDIPAGAVRDAAAAEILNQTNAFWTARAQTQVKLNYYRLVLRQLYWSGLWKGGAGGINKGPLPLPPKSIWHVPSVGNVR